VAFSCQLQWEYLSLTSMIGGPNVRELQTVVSFVAVTPLAGVVQPVTQKNASLKCWI